MRCIGLITHTVSRQELSKSHEVITARMIFNRYSIILLKLLVKYLFPCFPPLKSWTVGKLEWHFIVLLLLQDEVSYFNCFIWNLFDFFLIMHCLHAAQNSIHWNEATMGKFQLFLFFKKLIGNLIHNCLLQNKYGFNCGTQNKNKFTLIAAIAILMHEELFCFKKSSEVFRNARWYYHIK